MALGVDVLDVCEDQVTGRHDALPCLIERLLAGEGRKRGVQARVNATGMGGFEELCHKLRLQQRLPTRDGDATLTPPVAAVTFCLVK